MASSAEQQERAVARSKENQELGRIVARIRGSLGLHQSDLRQRIEDAMPGVRLTVAAISAYETGARSIPGPILWTILKVGIQHGVDVARIMASEADIDITPTPQSIVDAFSVALALAAKDGTRSDRRD